MKITTNKQYHTALAEIEGLIEKGFGNLTEKETKQLEQLSLAVEAFEAVKYPMPIVPTIPELLLEYMFENKLNRAQLSELLEVPNSTVSEIINGKKKLNLAIVKKLHEKLKIDGNFLLETA